MMLIGRASLPLFASLLARPKLARMHVAPLACVAASSGLDAWLEKALSAEQRRRTSLEKEMQAARGAERLSTWATLVVANLYRIDNDATSVVVEDWENGGAPTTLTFDASEGSPKQQADKAFAKARRLRRGSAVVSGLLEQSAARARALEQWRARSGAAAEEDSLLRAEIRRAAKGLDLKLKDLDEAADGADGVGGPLPRGKRGATQPEALFGSRTPGWNGREFTSPDGVPILVGRNRKQNEQLSLSLCRDPDVWMRKPLPRTAQPERCVRGDACAVDVLLTCNKWCHVVAQTCADAPAHTSSFRCRRSRGIRHRARSACRWPRTSRRFTATRARSARHS